MGARVGGMGRPSIGLATSPCIDSQVFAFRRSTGNRCHADARKVAPGSFTRRSTTAGPVPRERSSSRRAFDKAWGGDSQGLQKTPAAHATPHAWTQERWPRESWARHKTVNLRIQGLPDGEEVPRRQQMGIGQDSRWDRILMTGIRRLNILVLIAVKPQAFIPANPLRRLTIHFRQLCFKDERQAGCILKTFHSGGSNARPPASRGDRNVLNERECLKTPIPKHSNHACPLIKERHKCVARVRLSLQILRQRASFVDREAVFVDCPGLSKVVVELMVHHWPSKCLHYAQHSCGATCSGGRSGPSCTSARHESMSHRLGRLSSAPPRRHLPTENGPQRRQLQRPGRRPPAACGQRQMEGHSDR